MQKRSSALYRGRISLRPWRVGVLIDVDDEAQVQKVISNLTKVWGGMYMPILDVNAPESTLLEDFQKLDVDSVYCESENESMITLLRDNHIAWRGRGRYGPFDTGEFAEKGLLPANRFAGPPQLEDQPLLREPAASLAMAAFSGLDDTQSDSESRAGLTRSNHLLNLAAHYSRPAPYGIAVLREMNPRDVTWFWNCRALTGATYPILASSADFNRMILETLGNANSILGKMPAAGSTEGSQVLPVWGYGDLSGPELQRMNEWASSTGVTIAPRERDRAFAGTWFPGFDKIQSRTFRVESAPMEQLIPIRVPQLDIARGEDPFPGIIAAEVHFHEATGLDPRLTVSLPPYRQFSSLLDRPGYEIEQVRTSENGLVFGIQADTQELTVKNVFQLDVMRLLFPDPEVEVSQSDEGKFQTRAAQLFGGALSGHLAQPGVRAAIMEAGTRTTGVAMGHLKQSIEKNRGDWPDPLRTFNMDTKNYVDQQVNALLYSGMLTPSVRLQCHECRVTLTIRPSDLDTMFKCEFCGEDIHLALAIALHKPDWRFHLAGHLSADRVKAFLPAMAAFGVLGALNPVRSAPAPHVFGLEVRNPNKRKIEVDVAMVMPQDGWIAVLGEVKNNNPIDENDARNLFSLRDELASNNIVAIPLFATMKDSFSGEEKRAIRSAMSSEVLFAHRNGAQYPLAPLLLTRPDMSLPKFHDDHPWRWSRPGSGAGLIEVAYQSCVRHLGLSPVKPIPGGSCTFQFDAPSEGEE